MTALLSPYVWLLVVLAGVTAYLAVLAWRHRTEPGARPFATMMVIQTVWTLSYAAALVVFDPALRESLEVVEWLAGTLFPVWWLAFALEYSGRGEWVTRRNLAAASVLPLLTAVVIATNDAHHLMWSNYRIVADVPIATVTYDYGPWFVLQIAYSYAQMAAGFVLLVAVLFRYDTLYTDQAAAVGVGVLLPWVGNALWVLGLTPIPGLDLTQFFLAVSGVLLGHGLFRYDLLAVVPATRQIGEKTVVHDLDAGVVMLGGDGVVQWLNDAAAGTFGVAPDAAAGMDAADLLGQRVDLDADEVTVDLETETGHRTYRIRVSSITNQHGDAVGHALVLSDVTDERLRRQRLQVLNRVLRHNLRNEMNVVHLTAEHIADGNGDPAVHAERIIDQADAMVDLAAQVHRTERVVGGDVDPTDTVDAADVLASVADRVRAEHPDADLSVSVPDDLTVETDRGLLDAVLWNVLDNAVSHAGDAPRVAVEVDATGGWLVVRVADDGPGIPDHEVAAIRAGSETELLHGSGMGLWLVDWATTRLGGAVEFAESDLGGAAVTVRVPGADDG